MPHFNEDPSNTQAGAAAQVPPPASAAAQAQGLGAAAAADPHVPATAKEAPLAGPPPGDNVPFKEQVQGYSKYFAGKITGNDKEVQQGAARVRGVEEPPK